MSELPPSTVADLKALTEASGRAFASLLVVKRLAVKTASNGNPFLGLELGDRTGSFGCTVFSDSPAFETLKSVAEGSVVRIEGKIEYYQNRLAPRLLRATAVGEAELAASGALEKLVETAPEDAGGLWAEFQGFIEGIGHSELRATVRAV